ncbi:hypothetical protein FKX85_02665 [Echinicola soli]|uniref:Outer membrane protein beta-barrel domain-containing protein n=1 Tax=Echinicola soli TaxID=2591634 RepID=A0A514CDU7_9BACT|nr:hypothetical protein [Echinicola soli]QDH77995.1 hypothetical protein FKX85_02665 [Echinicola soli]
MMKEQFDKRLVEKIKNSFDHHEESFDQVEWEKFSQVYFNKPTKRKKLVLWPFIMSAIAASMTLLFVFYPYEKEIEKGVTDLKGSIAKKSKKLDEILKPIEDSTKGQVEEMKKPALASVPKTSLENSEERSDINKGVQRMTSAPIALSREPDFDTYDPLLMHSPDPIAGAASRLDRESQAKIDKSVANTRPAGQPRSTYMDEQVAQSWVDEWKEGDNNGKTTKNTNTIIKNDQGNESLVRLGVQAGPQTASNATSGMQLGAGVVSEFSISDRIKLDVGVNYAHQQFEPETLNKLPESMQMRAVSSAAPNEASYAVTNDYLGSEYTMSYYGLDIPINIKYKVMDKSKANVFLITGLSSMIYFDQKGVETFAVASKFTEDFTGALQFSESIQEYSQEYTPNSEQSNVDLGKMLNLSFGYEYNLSNGTFLSIEPYYKLPLGNLTFTNQQFSIGGVNLRMNFQFKK